MTPVVPVLDSASSRLPVLEPSPRTGPTRFSRVSEPPPFSSSSNSDADGGVNTCFVERHNGTDRSRCSRKVRKSYAFSKDWETHRAATMFSYFSDNFCWPVRTLRRKDADGRWQRTTPAMAAGLTDHV